MTVAARIKQSDIERAIRAAQNVAGENGSVTLDLQSGKIHIMLGHKAANDSGPNPWDKELDA